MDAASAIEDGHSTASQEAWIRLYRHDINLRPELVVELVETEPLVFSFCAA